MCADNPKVKNIGVLISGTGRTLENLNEKIKEGKLNATISIVISDRTNIKGVEIAKKHNNKIEIIKRGKFKNIYEFSRRIFEVLTSHDVSLVVLAGWLEKLYIPSEYEGRVINIHPALLPLFGGFRYYGEFVHKAVIESKMKVSGCTVHYVTNDYDSGPIIAQEWVEVKEEDTPQTLGERVFEKEKELYPRVINQLLQRI